MQYCGFGDWVDNPVVLYPMSAVILPQYSLEHVIVEFRSTNSFLSITGLSKSKEYITN